MNVRTHTGQLLGIAVAAAPDPSVMILVPSARHSAVVICGCMSVGKPGIRQGLDVGLGQLALAANEHRIVKLGDLNAHLTQLCGDALQMTRNNILHQNRTAAGCNGCHEGARLDLIRNDGVTAAVQALYTADLDHIGAGALNIRTHCIQEVRQIDNVRLLRAVLHNRLTLWPERLRA